MLRVRRDDSLRLRESPPSVVGHDHKTSTRISTSILSFNVHMPNKAFSIWQDCHAFTFVMQLVARDLYRVLPRKRKSRIRG